MPPSKYAPHSNGSSSSEEEGEEEEGFGLGMALVAAEEGEDEDQAYSVAVATAGHAVLGAEVDAHLPALPPPPLRSTSPPLLLPGPNQRAGAGAGTTKACQSGGGALAGGGETSMLPDGSSPYPNHMSLSVRVPSTPSERPSSVPTTPSAIRSDSSGSDASGGVHLFTAPSPAPAPTSSEELQTQLMLLQDEKVTAQRDRDYYAARLEQERALRPSPDAPAAAPMAEGRTRCTARERKSQLQRERRAAGRLEVLKPAGRVPFDSAGNPCQWTVAGWFDTSTQRLHVPARNRQRAAARAAVAAEKKAAKEQQDREKKDLQLRKARERQFDHMWKEFERHQQEKEREQAKYRKNAATFIHMGFTAGVAPQVIEPPCVSLQPDLAQPEPAMVKLIRAKKIWLANPRRAIELQQAKQCRGITKAGERCNVRSCMWDGPTSWLNPNTHSVSEPLRQGLDYCRWHSRQKPINCRIVRMWHSRQAREEEVARQDAEDAVAATKIVAATRAKAS